VAGGHFSAYTFLEPFLGRVAGFGADGFGLALGACGLANLAGSFAGERLAARGLRPAFIAVSLLPAAALLLTCWGLAPGAAPVRVQL
jgi:predicted MFS family arabinose efflux permease